MNKGIDCLFIGHNEMEFESYRNMVQSMGEKSAANRDLNLNFIKYKDQIYTAPDLYNTFNNREDEDFSLGNLFSPAIAYLGTYLHRRGLTFDYVNSFQKEKDELAAKLAKNNIQTIAIITTLYVSVLPVLEIISFIRKYNDTAKIIIGGPFISTQIKVALDEPSLQYFFKNVGADFYVNSSQGEATLVKIIQAVKHKESFAQIPNIAYRSEDHRYITTPLVPEKNDLGENMVDWSLFADRLNKFAAVRTAISCPFSCSFCGFPQHAGKYQCVDVSAVEAELNALDQLGTVRSLNFIDDTLNVPPARFKEILKMMIKNKYKFKWNSHYRCQFADRETVELMKESGCEGVFLGIESGNQQILKNMNKAATLEEYRKGMELLREYDIITYASFIIGFPGETEETVQDTVNFIEETKPTFFRTQLWYCDGITPIWDQREKFQIEGSQFEWSHGTMDSQKACDLIDTIFVNLKNSIWVPQYNFEFAGLFTLLHRGWSLDQLKDFINLFNQGIKGKLKNPDYQMSDDLIEQVKKINSQIPEEPAENIDQVIDKYEADFEF